MKSSSILVLWMALPISALQDPGPKEIDDLIRRLADDEIEARERAAERLVTLGAAARPALEAAAGAGNPEVAARCRQILARLFPFRILLKGAVFAKNAPVPATLVLENSSREEWIECMLGFDVKIKLLELYEEPPQEGRRHAGTYECRAGNGCTLSPSDFRTLAPGESNSIAFADLREHHGIEIAEEIEAKYPKFSTINPVLAGRYRMIARYRFDRAVYMKLCGKRCRIHDDPETMWNRCPEHPLEARVEFSLR